MNETTIDLAHHLLGCKELRPIHPERLKAYHAALTPTVIIGVQA